MDFTDRFVLVYGSGISGIAASKLLLANHAEVILFDEKEDIDQERLLSEFENTDHIKIVTGTIPESEMKRIDLVILSPGVPIDAPAVEAFQTLDIPVWGEVELAYCCQKGDVLRSPVQTVRPRQHLFWVRLWQRISHM